MFIGSHHSISITGKVIKDLELEQVNDVPTIRLSVPTNDMHRDSDGLTTSETTWFNITLTHKMAVAAHKALRKDDFIHVIGRLKPKIIPYQLDGKWVASYEVIPDQIIFMSVSKKEPLNIR